MANAKNLDNSLMIGGVKVKFPCKPYPSQLSMMSRIIKGLQNGSHCLLESPTGSGKSLALLCSALAWQEDMRQKADAQNSNCDQQNDACCANTSTDSAKEFEKDSGVKSKSCEKTTNQDSVPTIWFGTRTHKQIAQITHELARTGYKNVNMTILSSREHACIHPINEKSKNKNDGCRDLLKGRHADLPGSRCAFYQNVHRMRTHGNLYNCGLTEAWDLEDLVKLGRRLRACPYYSARELKTTASIIFCPYNYLIDPGIRSQMSINLKNQIIILDEAHNIEDSARDAASYSLNEMELINTISDLDHLIADTIRVEQHQPLHLLCTKIGQWLQTSSSNLDETSYETWSKVWMGKDFISHLEQWGITGDTLPILQKNYQEVLESNEENEEEDPRMLHSASQALLGGLFHVLSYLLFVEQKFAPDYRIAIMRKSEYGIPPPKRTRDGWISLSKRASKYFSINLHFWCLNPAVAFSDFASTRCIILTSGTLSPMSSFSSELGLSFPIQLEASHVIQDSQVWVGAVGHGPNGHQLQATYQNTNALNFQDDLGKVVLSVCRIVPHGVLCFFSSYKMLEKLCERWQNTGIWNEMCQKKAILSEPHGRNKSSFEEVLQSFYENISSADENGITGALLLAVCRGKVSEGLDFSDNNARAVITVGIPFPNFKDRQVELKRKYNDEFSRGRGLLSGSEWYEIQAFRALNQALGRCIRHKNDWGALIIVDDRFCKNPKKYCKGLSKWVRQKVRTYHGFQSVEESLTSFCHAQKFAMSQTSTERLCTSLDSSFQNTSSAANDSFFFSSLKNVQPTLNSNVIKTPCSDKVNATKSFVDLTHDTPVVAKIEFKKNENSPSLSQFKFEPKNFLKSSKFEQKRNEIRPVAQLPDDNDVILIPSTPEKLEIVQVIPESPESLDVEDCIKPVALSSTKRKNLANHIGKTLIAQQLAKKCKQAISFDEALKSNITKTEQNDGEDSQELFAPKTRRRRSLKASRKDDKKTTAKIIPPADATSDEFSVCCMLCRDKLYSQKETQKTIVNNFKYIKATFPDSQTLYTLNNLPENGCFKQTKIPLQDDRLVLDTIWCNDDKLAFQFYMCQDCKSIIAFHPVNSDRYSQFYILTSQVTIS